MNRKIVPKRSLTLLVMVVMFLSQAVNVGAVEVGAEIGAGGKPAAAGTKAVEIDGKSGKFATVGDKLIYTITAYNDEEDSTWYKVKLHDTLPVGIDFDSSYGVWVDGIQQGSADYDYDGVNRTLIVSLGDLEGKYEELDGTEIKEEKKTITFGATVNEGAYGETITNTVDIKGWTYDEVEEIEIQVSDDSIEVASGYRVTYKANGGTGEDFVSEIISVTDDTEDSITDDTEDSITVITKAITKVIAKAIKKANTTVAANPFTRSGYTFTSWNTEANGSGNSYVFGDTIIMDKDTTLYAQWNSSGGSTGGGSGGGTTTTTPDSTTTTTPDSTTATTSDSTTVAASEGTTAMEPDSVTAAESTSVIETNTETGSNQVPGITTNKAKRSTSLWPRTGDDNNVLLVTSFCAMSLIVCIALTRRRWMKSK